MTKPRARGAKAETEKPATPAPVDAPEHPATRAARNGGKDVVVTRVERYVEPPPPPDEPPQVAEEDVPICRECNDEGCDLCLPELELLAPAPKSEIEIVVEEAASDPSHKLIVWSLPNFDVDRRADKAADKDYCTTLQPVTIDYLATVARHFGAGHFLFELYEPGRAITKRWHKKIKGAIVEPPPAATMPAQALETVNKGNYKGEIKRLREAAEDLVTLRDLMGWEPPPPAAPALALAPAPASASQEIAPLDQLLIKAALEKPELSDRILARILPPAENAGGGGVAGIIGEAMKHPAEARALIQEIVGAIRSGLAPLTGDAAANGNGAPAAAPAAPAPAPLAPADDLERTLKVVVDDLKKNKRVGRAADSIDELLIRRPEYVEMFNQLLAVTPAEFLAELSTHAGENLAEYGHALDFIINLSDALRPPGEADSSEDGA